MVVMLSVVFPAVIITVTAMFVPAVIVPIAVMLVMGSDPVAVMTATVTPVIIGQGSGAPPPEQ